MNSELPVSLSGQRSQLRLFSLKAPAKGGSKITWTEIPFQLDPVDDEGRFVFFKSESWRMDKIDRHDRLIFHTEHFGRKWQTGEEAPCRGRVVYQFKYQEATGGFAYLALCNPSPMAISMPPHAPGGAVPAVAYIKDKSKLSTSQYTYEFNAENQILFERISIGSDSESRQVIAEKSELLIKSDVKKFFTMRFDSSQIESYLEETRPGLVGTLARVSFYLKILFFKIKMSLTTDVTFYDDVGHIPMVVQLPVDAPKYLHPRSGILYSWKLAPEVKIIPELLRMPLVDPEASGKGYAELAKFGISRCVGESCRYGFTAAVGEKTLAMEFEIPRYMVMAGFFPQLVQNVAEHNEDMGWGLHRKALEQSRMGLYFEVSGLPEGGHPWDFWLRLGSTGNLNGTCPRGLHISRL